MKKFFHSTAGLFLLLMLCSCLQGIVPERSYIGKSRKEVADILDENAFRARQWQNCFLIEASGSKLFYSAGREMTTDHFLMNAEVWSCDYFPRCHGLFGWRSGAKWHFKVLEFENNLVIRETAVTIPYDGGSSPFPQYPKNFHRVNDSICRSGQPSADEFSSLFQFDGLKSVINLRNHHSDHDEIGQLPLNLYQIPLNAGEITRDELVKILKTVRDAPKPLLIHCWHGSDRTGAAVAACRIVFDRFTVQQAVAELKEPRYGHHYSVYPNIEKLLLSINWQEVKEEVFIKPSLPSPVR